MRIATNRLLYLFILGCMLTACNAPLPSLRAPEEPTPSPYPDTPSPPRIDAPLEDSPALVKIHFVSQLEGWGVTETGVVRTNDGGFTWYNVTPVELTEAGYAVEWFVLDNAQAWIQQPDFSNFPGSGFQFRTRDGGLTWDKFAVPFSGANLSFLDENNGWALADLGVGAGSNAVAVYQTSDAGTTWDLRYINDPNHPIAEESLPLGGLKYGLTPLDMQTAWIFGVVYAPGTAYLFRTDDAGSRWLQVDLPIPQGMENGELSIEHIEFVSSTDAYLIMRTTLEQVHSAVYVSNDAGNSWLLTPTLIPGGATAEVLSAEEMFLYNREQFYVTRDAARTWTIIPPDVRFGDTFAAMDFLTPSAGFVLTLDPDNHRSLYRTDDGGSTWFPVVP